MGDSEHNFRQIMKPTQTKKVADDSSLKTENSYLKSKIDKMADELEENLKTIENLEKNLGKTKKDDSQELEKLKNDFISTEKQLDSERNENKEFQATIKKLEAEILYLEKRSETIKFLELTIGLIFFKTQGALAVIILLTYQVMFEPIMKTIHAPPYEPYSN